MDSLQNDDSQAESARLVGRKNVMNLSWVSLLNDLGSELLARLVPLFVSGVLGAPMSAVGTIEGLADSAATLMKPVFGHWSDRLKKRKTFVVWGYCLSALARPFLAIAGSWPEVAFLRFSDRLGKGIRSAPRDALIADSGIASQHGRHFGINRAMDTLGALIGVSIFGLWVWHRGEAHLTLRTWEILALVCSIPGLLAVVVTVAGVVEAPTLNVPKPAAEAITRPRLNPVLKRYLIVIAVFGLANSSDAFILLRAKELGYSLAGILGVIALFNVVSSMTAIPAAAFSDRVGRRTLIALGWIIYAATYAGMGWPSLPFHSVMFAMLVAVYGLFYGFTESVERAWIADLAPREQRGRAYGVFGLTLGIAALPASIGFGWLWDHYGSGAAFLADSALAWFAVALLYLLMPRGVKGR